MTEDTMECEISERDQEIIYGYRDPRIPFFLTEITLNQQTDKWMLASLGRPPRFFPESK